MSIPLRSPVGPVNTLRARNSSGHFAPCTTVIVINKIGRAKIYEHHEKSSRCAVTKTSCFMCSILLKPMNEESMSFDDETGQYTSIPPRSPSPSDRTDALLNSLSLSRVEPQQVSCKCTMDEWRCLTIVTSTGADTHSLMRCALFSQQSFPRVMMHGIP
jgi:hypothetical protein